MTPELSQVLALAVVVWTVFVVFLMVAVGYWVRTALKDHNDQQRRIEEKIQRGARRL